MVLIFIAVISFEGIGICVMDSVRNLVLTRITDLGEWELLRSFVEGYSEQKNRPTKGQISLVSQIAAQ